MQQTKKRPSLGGQGRLSKYSSADNYTPSHNSRKFDAEEVASMFDPSPRRTRKDTLRVTCPVHGGRSLEITQKPHRVVMHCWGGCDYWDIIATHGIKSHQLNYNSRPPRPIVKGSSITRHELLDMMDTEWRIIRIAIHDLTRFIPITNVDAERAILACKRYTRAQEVLR